MLLILGFAFLAGIFTALSPCILPVLPAILTAGIAEGRLRPLGTILGLTCSFSFFTLTLTWIVQTTGISPEILRYAAIALIFFFGLVMIFPRLSNWFAKVTAPLANLGQKIQGPQTRQGFWGGVIFGIALGLVWTPCAGPILGAITTLAASGAINTTTVLMTLAYSLGAGIPMFLFAYGSNKLIATSRFLSRYTERIRQFFGVLMLIFALVLTLNWDMLISQKLSGLLPEISLEQKLPVEQKLETIQARKVLPQNGPAPELTGITGWINSPPLTLSELRGKVVLIDFWTYSCINCLRTLPYLKNWYRNYEQYGFVVIGVHTPEFQFEKNYDNVKQAVERLGIKYPVALDNNYATWNAYHNRYWPAHYLIDQQGNIRMIHYGEGAYLETENGIRTLLGLNLLTLKEATIVSRPISPETYLGLSRAEHYAIRILPQKTVDYQYQETLGDDQVGLKGAWRAEQEYIVAEGDNSYLNLNFLAKQVYLVLAGSSTIPLQIFLDGQLYGQIIVNADKKYDIVTTTYGRHQLSLKIPQGVRAYAFTFGDE